MNEIYKELQVIDEFEANFNPTPATKARREYLTNKLKQHGTI